MGLDRQLEDASPTDQELSKSLSSETIFSVYAEKHRNPSGCHPYCRSGSGSCLARYYCSVPHLSRFSEPASRNPPCVCAGLLSRHASPGHPLIDASLQSTVVEVRTTRRLLAVVSGCRTGQRTGKRHGGCCVDRQTQLTAEISDQEIKTKGGEVAVMMKKYLEDIRETVASRLAVGGQVPTPTEKEMAMLAVLMAISQKLGGSPSGA